MAKLKVSELPLEIQEQIVGYSSGDFVHENTSVLWRCGFGHEWRSRLIKRLSGFGCVYCSGAKILAGWNDVATLYKDILEFWDDPRSPIGLKQSEDVFWRCRKGHSFKVSALSYKKCVEPYPYCGGRLAIPGVNGLDVKFPELAKKFSLLNEVSVSEVLPYSNKKYIWFCSMRHYYTSSPNKQVAGHGCTYCSNKRVLSGFNDLAYLFPSIALEYSGKNSLPAHEIASKSNKEVEWSCSKCGGEWKTSVAHRTNLGNACPHCRNKRQFSVGERELGLFVKSLLPDSRVTLNSRRVINPKELDIYIEAKKLAIEYNGDFWHRETVSLKPELCALKGILLLTVWESDWKRSPKLVEDSLKAVLLKGEPPNPILLRYSSVFGRDNSFTNLSSEYLDYIRTHS